jgi:tetratricopeptide (TPR) repeat protein
MARIVCHHRSSQLPGVPELSELITSADIAERNRNVVDLQRQGRMDEALAAARDAEHLALEHLPETDLERAKSICNLAAIQAAVGGDANNALRTFNPGLDAMRAAVGEQSPFYGRMLSICASLCASLLAGAGRPQEAELLFVRAFTILASSPENENYVTALMWELAGLHDTMAKQEARAAPPPSPELDKKIGAQHFDRSATGNDQNLDPDNFPPEMRSLAEQMLASSRDMMASWSTHGIAQAIIERNWQHGEPFALLLRGFEGEAYTYMIRNPQQMMSPIEPLREIALTDIEKPSEVELLLDLLRDKLKALAVASPASADPGQRSQGAKLPRLILSDQSWLEDVRSLIKQAHLIVVDCKVLHPGLRQELEAVAQGGKCDNTVIVLHRDRPRSDEPPNLPMIIAQAMGGTIESGLEREWVTREQPLLAPFKRITYIEDLIGKDLASLPWFEDLVASVPLIRSATRLGQAGTALVVAGEPRDGAEYLQMSLFISQGIPGSSERATIWFNLGMLARDSRQFEEALKAFAECHAAGVAMNNASDQGRSLSMMGDVYLEAGRNPEAVKALSDSLAPLEAAADNAYLAHSLRRLAQACQALGQKDEAAAVQAELERLTIEGSWSRDRADKKFAEFF